MSLAWSLLTLARPPQWIKNSIVLFPLAFARRLGDPAAWACALMAALAFCLVSSAGYILNDLRDREEDRLHPVKRKRPLAAGLVSAGAAAAMGVALLAVGLGVAALTGGPVLTLCLAYVALQAAYTLALKHRMIADVICIALGFVFRAVAGALAISVPASPWLIICAFTLCLFMGFCKRRLEVAALGNDEAATRYRRTLAGYTPELLTHLITLSAALAIVSYLMYATSARTIHEFRTSSLVYALPLVIYAIARFAMVSMRGAYNGPTELILRDRPFQASAALWGALTLFLIYQGHRLDAWLGVAL